MISNLFVLIYVALIIFFYNGNAHSYSVDDHRKLTEELIDLNAISLNNHLNNIGLSKGILQMVNSKAARKWIEDGSYYLNLA